MFNISNNHFQNPMYYQLDLIKYKIYNLKQRLSELEPMMNNGLYYLYCNPRGLYGAARTTNCLANFGNGMNNGICNLIEYVALTKDLNYYQNILNNLISYNNHYN